MADNTHSTSIFGIDIMTLYQFSQCTTSHSHAKIYKKISDNIHMTRDVEVSTIKTFIMCIMRIFDRMSFDLIDIINKYSSYTVCHIVNWPAYYDYQQILSSYYDYRQILSSSDVHCIVLHDNICKCINDRENYYIDEYHFSEVSLYMQDILPMDVMFLTLNIIYLSKSRYCEFMAIDDTSITMPHTTNTSTTMPHTTNMSTNMSMNYFVNCILYVSNIINDESIIDTFTTLSMLYSKYDNVKPFTFKRVNGSLTYNRVNEYSRHSVEIYDNTPRQRDNEDGSSMQRDNEEVNSRYTSRINRLIVEW